jgi:hypothetical protein
MPKRVWIFYRITKSVSIFYMTFEIANARIKDIAQRILPEKQIT